MGMFITEGYEVNKQEQAEQQPPKPALSDEQASIELLAEYSLGGTYEDVLTIINIFVAEYKHWYIAEHGTDSAMDEALRIGCTKALKDFLEAGIKRVDEMVQAKGDEMRRAAAH